MGNMLLREVLTIGSKTLVECYTKENFNQIDVYRYFVCEDYKAGRPYPDAVRGGRMFANIKAALEHMLGKHELEEELPYADLLEITKDLASSLDEDEQHELIENYDMSNEVAKALGIKRKRRYDIVEATFDVRFSFTKTFVVPTGKDIDEYNLDEYVDLTDVLDDVDMCDYDTEVETSDVMYSRRNISDEDIIRYSYEYANDVDDFEDYMFE